MPLEWSLKPHSKGDPTEQGHRGYPSQEGAALHVEPPQVANEQQTSAIMQIWSLHLISFSTTLGNLLKRSS